ncbi:MAG: hypothetical protein AAF515_22250 [Pseudomonadota bacterium]
MSKSPGLVLLVLLLHLASPRADADDAAASGTGGWQTIRIGETHYNPKHHTLARLTGAYFELANLRRFIENEELTEAVDLVAEMQRRLDAVGFRMQTKDQMEADPAQAQFDIWPSAKPDCCTVGFWANLTQAARVTSNPAYKFRLGTWGGGGNFQTTAPESCPNKGLWLAEELLAIIDAFAADYEKARRELHVAPAIVAPEREGMDCDTQRCPRPVWTPLS